MAVPALSFLALLLAGGPVLDVQVMTTPSELRRGLQGHRPLSPQEGMLFVMPEFAVAQFWMKDVTFPIDIIFIGPGGTVANVHPSVPPCPSAPCPLYESAGPVTHVLELAAGMAKRYEIDEGRRLEIDATRRRVQLPPPAAGLRKPVPKQQRH
jgi:uncharacterized protein